MNISLQQLEYIIAVDTYRHYVTAAEKSFVTQPTLSMQIKKMEEQLGVVIFDRTKQPIIPTDLGKAIIEQARIIINQTKQIEEIIKNHQEVVSGEIYIGIIPTLASYIVPRFAGELLRKYPEVTLHIKELMTHEIIAELKNETLDVGLIVTPIKDKGLFYDVLFYEEILLYSDDIHKKKYLSFKQLPTENMWLLSSGHCFRNQMINLCQIAGEQQHLNFKYESGSLETLKKMVDKEGGATLFPELATLDLNKSDKAKIVHIGEENPYREVSLVYTRSQVKTKLIRVVGDEIKSQVPKHMIEKRENVVEWN
jgi:LysR family hydrogen peroxide-inducible transcriptional activator